MSKMVIFSVLSLMLSVASANTDVAGIDQGVFKKQMDKMLSQCDHTAALLEDADASWINPVAEENRCLKSGISIALQTEGRIALAINGHEYCEEENSDPDGDGYGWENQKSCIVAESTADRYDAKYPHHRYVLLRAARLVCGLQRGKLRENRCLKAAIGRM